MKFDRCQGLRHVFFKRVKGIVAVVTKVFHLDRLDQKAPAETNGQQCFLWEMESLIVCIVPLHLVVLDVYLVSPVGQPVVCAF
jgi:hypothetical protein